MAWITPQFTRTEVDHAGKLLLTPPPAPETYETYAPRYAAALRVMYDWRSAHAFPLNTFQNTLRRKATRIDSKSLVAQRLKRKMSILLKLSRFPRMRLSQMQDIGGCRAVVFSARKAERLAKLYEGSDLKHELNVIDNYIDSPKESGYRSIHLIYKYFSDRNETYNALKIEIQFRSRLQHTWATAVETAGTFMQQSLKSSIGEDRWLRFFSLMGSEIAAKERRPSVPNTPDGHTERKRELQHLEEELGVTTHLAGFGAALQVVHKQTEGRPYALGHRYYLIELDVRMGKLLVTPYGQAQSGEAFEDYGRAEELVADNPSLDAVLVSVDSVSSLPRAFPNYFLDTNMFIDLIHKALT